MGLRLIETAVRPLRREPRRADGEEVVSGGHQDDLEALLEFLRANVELEGRCSFSKPPNDSEAERSLRAHYPDSYALLRQWNKRLERDRAAPERLWKWLAQTAARQGIAEPPFSIGPLIDRLAVMTVEKALDGALGVPQHLGFERSAASAGGVRMAVVYLEREPLARIRAEDGSLDLDEVERVEATIRSLFDEARGSEEAREIGRAHDSLLDLKRDLLEHLAADAAVDPIPVNAGCPVCRRRRAAVAGVAAGDGRADAR
jgi:hypothetical protein